MSNAWDNPGLPSVTCYAESGESWKTSVAKIVTEEDARLYFVGRWFNLGSHYVPDGDGMRIEEDWMVRVTRIEYTGV